MTNIDCRDYMALRVKMKECQRELIRWHARADWDGKHDEADQYLALCKSMGRVAGKLKKTFLNK